MMVFLEICHEEQETFTVITQVKFCGVKALPQNLYYYEDCFEV